MRKYILFLMLCLPLLGQAQNTVEEAQKKAEEAQRMAKEAARMAEEARLAALKAEAAAKEAEAAKAKAEAATGQPIVKSKVSNNTTAKEEQSSEDVSKWAKRNQMKAEAKANSNNYLEGAVPLVDGKVEWQLLLDVPNKSADQIFDSIGQLFYDMTQEEGQLERTRIALTDKEKHEVVAMFQEWLQFSKNAIAIDRTDFRYTLIAECSDGHLDVKMCRLSYVYEEGRKSGFKRKAEDWITDKNALNKSKTKLYPIPGKFRKKTIERKNQIFEKIKNHFGQAI